jgi:orotidine-5'-phosphate decarboxylase
MNFYDKLASMSEKNKSLVCVGLDTSFAKIPEHLKSRQYPLFDFNREIIDATAHAVCAYKPNIAFYEAASDGLVGLLQLKKTFEYVLENYPEIPLILDAKNADIGNTNEGYVSFAFDYLKADAITLHPYLGHEALSPFLDRKDKGLFILCKTSNPGAGELQDLRVANPQSADKADKPLYQYVAEKVAKEWNMNKNCGLVVGATYPTELEIVRHIVGDGFPLLIPGVGAQGGDVEKTVKAGVDKQGFNAIINSSRGIIYAGSGDDFAQKAAQETEKLKDTLNKFR